MRALTFRSHHIPWLFVAGFGVVIAVNGVMMWLAIGSFSGLYSDHARERGLHYNRIVAEQQSRDALHWQVDAKWQADTGQLLLAVTGCRRQAADRRAHDGRIGAAGREAAASPGRPCRPGEGRFDAHVDLPARGNWDLDIIVDAGDRHFALTKRLFLR